MYVVLGLSIHLDRSLTRPCHLHLVDWFAKSRRRPSRSPGTKRCPGRRDWPASCLLCSFWGSWALRVRPFSGANSRRTGDCALAIGGPSRASSLLVLDYAHRHCCLNGLFAFDGRLDCFGFLGMVIHLIGFFQTSFSIEAFCEYFWSFIFWLDNL